MNRSKLKNYAPQARKDFIHAVTDRASQYGLTSAKIEPMTEKGDVVLIAGKPFPKAIGDKRKRLEERIKKYGFDQTMEAMAYTWFNRLVAIRYMELHGYLEHGFRVLSHPEGNTQPEILEKAQYVDLPGLDQKKVIELKLDGTKEDELYRLLLTAQFNALSKAMPFLFEKLDDETELLLPDSLLNSDSLIRKLVNEIDEEDWQAVEIIGWLYQFYISDKKDEVIGKVVKSEDIPAATQLFTPNWIVKYLVQNTIGRQWLATYPQSSLRSKMEYYIEPADQTPEVQEQLKAITPTSLNPEELTLLDPACGSGHILVEAYDLFKTIYEERGYRAKDIPALILQKNLFGLEIDDRAAQLAAFALMMKARADYSRIFDSEAQPNVLSFAESKGLDASEIAYALNAPINKEESPPSEYLMEDIEEEKTPLFSKKVLAKKGHVSQADIASLLDFLENAKTFGSLIQVPPKLVARLPEIEQRLYDVLNFGDLTHVSAHVLKPLLQQARLLARQYDAVVANPPYMGGKYFAEKLKDFVADKYKEAKADLYACFIQRNLVFAKANGFVGMITIPNWMFLSSFEAVRTSLFDFQSIDTFIHNGRGVFGSDFGSCSFVIRNYPLAHYSGVFRRLFEKQGSVSANEELERRFFDNLCYQASPEDFKKLPGKVVAYWISDQLRSAFAESCSFSEVAQPRQGLATADDGRFLRFWHEVSLARVEIGCDTGINASSSKMKWFPFLKGGSFRKWHGNQEYLIDWENNGERIKAFRPRAVVRNEDAYFRAGISWSLISISSPSFRLFDRGFIIGHKGPGIYSSEANLPLILAFLNSCVVTNLLAVLSPAVGFEIGQIQDLPYRKAGQKAAENAGVLVEFHRQDWNTLETSWDFQAAPLLIDHRNLSIEAAYLSWQRCCRERLDNTKRLEEENNRLFIEAYGLQDELSPQVPDDQITLYRPDREEDIKRLLSYAIGCMMGRYSLDKSGLIYAHSGNQGFDPAHYKTFRADDDGIIPLLENDWGIRDDATNRIFEFVSVAWPKEHLDENLKFVADSLSPSNGEQPKDTIRRYLATGFYKHHLSMYKKRPIYWMFSSGKQRAFQCLVYLHRYNEGTLARMRTEYVIPLMGKMTARLEHLQGPPEQKGAGGEIEATKAVTVKRKLEKERDKIKKQLAELQAFDGKLRHYADLRIKLELDDGVKVNYGKFSDPEYGDILAEVKAICGTKDED